MAEHACSKRVVVGATETTNGCIKYECGCNEYRVEKYFPKAAAAKIEMNGYYYLTLDDALYVAEGGETITLHGTVVGEGLVIEKDITINFNGNIFVASTAVEGTVAAVKIAEGAEVTFIGNGGLDVLTANNTAFGILVLNEGKLTTIGGVKLNGKYLYNGTESWVVYNAGNGAAELSAETIITPSLMGGANKTNFPV